MLLFLCELPIGIAAILLVIAPTIIAMCGPVLVRRRVDLLRLTTNNEIAGFKFASVGVIYAVILAFAVIAVWDKFSEAQTAVAKEAGAAATLYRLTSGSEPETVAARNALTNYLKLAVNRDWPAMAVEKESHETTVALNSLYAAVLHLPDANFKNSLVFGAMLGELETITQARRLRLHLGAGIVPGMLWMILVTGAALTIGFTFFFGIENLWAQVAMTGILSTIVLMGLLVILSFDHSFTGSVHIGAEPIQTVIDDFAGGS